MLHRVILSAQVRETLLTRILNGTYQPGDRLVESQIAKELGTSQSPVREALRDLVAMHFVEVEPYKGARVRMIDPAEVAQIYPVRAALEELAGQLAAPNLKGNVGDLEAIYAQMQDAARADDIKALTMIDAEFHRVIVEAAGNSILSETWSSLRIESRTFVTTVKLMLSDLGLMSVVEMHRPIIEALRSGDAEKSGAEMREHVGKFAELFRKGNQDGPTADRPVHASS
ncbi:MAG: GntR family transcriptional regulator [Burkholderiaceae bacterium]|nr:GntR family transcriptional regulator [Burkholderiaceae bacterium]